MTAAPRRKPSPSTGHTTPRRRRPGRAPARTAAKPDATPELPPLDAARKLRLAAGDRRSQILAAALQVFSEQGFHGARTRELAERAGVSEALVFSHFPTKEAILRALLDVIDFPGRIRYMEEHFGRMTPREGLLSLAELVLTNLREQPDVFRVVFFGILETPEMAGRFYHEFISRILALESKLFARAFAARRGRAWGVAVDPDVVARSFHGTLLFYNIAGAILRLEPLPRDPKSLAAAIVNVYLPEGAS
jgi:AcrR family transcriptional regulator